jgi:uncharacterized protein YcnI
MPRLVARLGIVTTVALGLTIGAVQAAGAHVTVHSDDAVQGGYAELAFRVPTESDTASTSKLAVSFPADAPIAAVSVQPHPGWTYQVTRSTVASPIPDGDGWQVTETVSQLEWTAASADSAVKPGEYEVFRIAAGPLPKTDRLVFKVVQTYTDGQVVRWIDEPAASGPEPEHPAPVLVLAPAAGDTLGDVTHAGHTATPAEPASSSGGGTPTIVWLALGVTTVAVLAALWAVLIAIRTARRRGGDAAPA